MKRFMLLALFSALLPLSSAQAAEHFVIGNYRLGQDLSEYKSFMCQKNTIDNRTACIGFGKQLVVDQVPVHSVIMAFNEAGKSVNIVLSIDDRYYDETKKMVSKKYPSAVCKVAGQHKSCRWTTETELLYLLKEDDSNSLFTLTLVPRNSQLSQKPVKKE